ncbi:hypothetical protein HK096_002930 [Nowakowskiella sp. JEL0078]|nr:hypothetical protein HK096_002930 [Nowakowskiella sp. JEL0078]
MANAEEVTNFVDNLETSLEAVEVFLSQLFTTPLDILLRDLDPLGRAKLEVNVCFAINTLIFVYLRMEGANPKDFPVIAELERVKKYLIKIRQAEGKYKPKMSVDKAAAGRFIKHNLSSNKVTAPLLNFEFLKLKERKALKKLLEWRMNLKSIIEQAQQKRRKMK